MLTQIVDSLIIFTARYLFIGVVGLALLFLVLSRPRRPLELLIAAVVIGGVAYLLSVVGTNLISDPRPFLVSGQPPLIPSATDNGFPSDHTLLVATVAALVSLVDRRAGIGLGLIALVIGLARVYTGVHHLLDVFGSFLIVGIALGLYLAGRQIWRNRRRAIFSS